MREEKGLRQWKLCEKNVGVAIAVWVSPTAVQVSASVAFISTVGFIVGVSTKPPQDTPTIARSNRILNLLVVFTLS